MWFQKKLSCKAEFGTPVIVQCVVGSGAGNGNFSNFEIDTKSQYFTKWSIIIFNQKYMFRSAINVRFVLWFWLFLISSFSCKLTIGQTALSFVSQTDYVSLHNTGLIDVWGYVDEQKKVDQYTLSNLKKISFFLKNVN